MMLDASTRHVKGDFSQIYIKKTKCTLLLKPPSSTKLKTLRSRCVATLPSMKHTDSPLLTGWKNLLQQWTDGSSTSFYFSLFLSPYKNSKT